MFSAESKWECLCQENIVFIFLKTAAKHKLMGIDGMIFSEYYVIVNLS